MVNVHRICRLCMVDIGIQGVDCMKIDEMRNAIQSLHQLEIKEDDPCSKRICQSCVSLLVDFIMHQRTVKDTQTKIKQLINLQEQVNSCQVEIKDDTNDDVVAANAEPNDAVPAAVDQATVTIAPQPQSLAHTSKSSQQNGEPANNSKEQSTQNHSKKGSSSHRSEKNSTDSNKSARHSKSDGHKKSASRNESTSSASNKSTHIKDAIATDRRKLSSGKESADKVSKSARHNDSSASESNKSTQRHDKATSDPTKAARRSGTVNGASLPKNRDKRNESDRNTRSASREPTNVEKKRSRSVMRDDNEQTESSQTKRTKLTQRLSSGTDGSATNASQTTNTSTASTSKHTNEVTKNTLKPPPNTVNSKRYLRVSDTQKAGTSSSDRQRSIQNYFSKMCTKCNSELKTTAEIQFHDKCHSKKQCIYCKKSVRCNEIKDHVDTCLLIHGEMTMNDLMHYMRPVSVTLRDFQKDEMAKKKKKKKSSTSSGNASNVDDVVEKESDVVQPRKRKSGSKLIVIESSDEDRYQDTRTAASATAAKQTVNVVGDTNSATPTTLTATRMTSTTTTTSATVPSVAITPDMPSHKKTAVRRESTIQRMEKCTVMFAKDTSVPIIWDHLGTNTRLFHTQSMYPKVANSNEFVVEKTAMNNQFIEWEKIRVKIAAVARTVPVDASREVIARKISDVQRMSQTRQSISEGERLISHENAMTLLPVENIGRPPNVQSQPIPPKNRRKSVHGSIVNGPPTYANINNNNNQNRTLPILPVPIAPRPSVLPTGYTIHYSPNKAIQSRIQTPTEPQMYNRPTVFHANPNSSVINPNGSVINMNLPTTSAAPHPHPHPPTPAQPISFNQFIPTVSSSPPVQPRVSTPLTGTVKVLSVNELNSRAVQSNNNENNLKPNNAVQPERNGLKMKYVAPKQPGQGNVGEENLNPIHVTLIKRSGNELELTLTQGGQRMIYDTLTESQQDEVRKSLLANDVWKEMLNHIKIGRPSELTLSLFRKLLPPSERDYFFASYDAARLANNNQH